MVRPIRAFALTTVGVIGGFSAAAAVAKRALPSRGGEESDELGLVAIFDGIDLENRASAFAGGSALAWFGGISLDLREATLAPSGARLSVHAVFGGVAVRVPAGWRLESNSSPVESQPVYWTVTSSPFFTTAPVPGWRSMNCSPSGSFTTGSPAPEKKSSGPTGEGGGGEALTSVAIGPVVELTSG